MSAYTAEEIERLSDHLAEIIRSQEELAFQRSQQDAYAADAEHAAGYAAEDIPF